MRGCYDGAWASLNPNFTDYKIPPVLDIPDEIIPIMAKPSSTTGPTPPRGIGERTWQIEIKKYQWEQKFPGKPKESLSPRLRH